VNEWDASSYAAKDNVLRIVRQEAEALFELASGPEAWSAPTACPRWEVRDIVGHLIDLTERYFTGFYEAASQTASAQSLGLTVMREHLEQSAKEHRGLGQDEAIDRLRADFEKMMEICAALTLTEWREQQVTDRFMGPLPAYYYPVCQLMNYSVHGWDIRQGAGQAHGLGGDTADMLVPFMFGVWQATVAASQDPEALAIGIRVSGRNAVDYLVSISSDGLSYALQDVSGLPAVIEFDPGSLVLAAFGRVNAGTIRGDRAVAGRFLNSFFRI
jgi:uncharacterized protein (TIGR03083 family)